MKRPVSWHSECLLNWQASLVNEAEAVARAKKRLDAQMAKMQFYRSQITRAIDEGRTGFDQERFNKPRGTR